MTPVKLKLNLSLDLNHEQQQKQLHWRCISHQAVIFLLLLALPQSSALTPDGDLLLAFKSSILNDSNQVLSNWYFWDQTPCNWFGVACGHTPQLSSRVISLSLPNSNLLGSIPSSLLTITHLHHLNLSNNSLNGSLPFNSSTTTTLISLDLSGNWLSGNLPSTFPTSLQTLNLSDNALSGPLPPSIATSPNLTTISLKSNYFSGELPSNFNSVTHLDLSSNLLNSSISSNFGGGKLTYFNISYNRLSAEIPQTLGEQLPETAIIDLSFNNLSGQIPVTNLFQNQNVKSYSGNPDLCGRPLKNPCPIQSTLSNPPNVTDSPPAIAAMPKSIPADSSGGGGGGGRELHLGAILGIVAGDLAGIVILGFVFFYVYRIKKRRSSVKDKVAAPPSFGGQSGQPSPIQTPVSDPVTSSAVWCGCLRKQNNDGDADSTASSTVSDSSDSDENDVSSRRLQNRSATSDYGVGGGAISKLVNVDGGDGGELELETLLKASAYILGATGSSIMYRAVLENGSTLAVRRIGDAGPDHRCKDFETQIRSIGKLVHPNVVRVRGFYWGPDQKLIIYDFVPNGSLATARYKKAGSSPCLMPWEVRLKVVKGVARGLAYIHEKKHVHGNLKPSNVLLGYDFEPKIGDFGLERILAGDAGYKVSGSSRIFGSKRSTASRESFHDTGVGLGPSPSPSPSSFGMSPYVAPESLRSLKPNPKWDVYSFGVLFLELLTGKITSYDETGQNNMEMLFVEDRNRVIRMADVTIRGEVEGKEDALMACFKLGISCVSVMPQKRPSMKEVIQVLEKLPSSSSSSSSPHFCRGF